MAAVAARRSANRIWRSRLSLDWLTDWLTDWRTDEIACLEERRESKRHTLAAIKISRAEECLLYYYYCVCAEECASEPASEPSMYFKGMLEMCLIQFNVSPSQEINDIVRKAEKGDMKSFYVSATARNWKQILITFFYSAQGLAAILLCYFFRN